MTIKFRLYDHTEDYGRIGDFLISHHQPGNLDGNWLEPAWEYNCFHGQLDPATLDKIAIWEDAGQMVGVAHCEWRWGEAFFEFHPAYRFLAAEMLDYAERNLVCVSEPDGQRRLCAYVNDNDPAFLSLVQARGYTKDPDGTRPLYRFNIPTSFPAITLPAGFRLTSLAEECDWAKVHRALWRGFDHAGEPPITAEHLEDRRRMFDTPKSRRDLKIAAVAPNGDFVAFCGMFYEPAGRFGYVEPVATDPTYRRLGLGRAAVLEGVRRCAELGATVAYVGSDQSFYQALGFTKVHDSECWVTQTLPDPVMRLETARSN